METALSRARKRWSDLQPLPEVSTAVPQPPANDEAATLEELERQHILAALERNHGNRTATAVELGISRRTLHYRLTEYLRKGYLLE